MSEDFCQSCCGFIAGGNPFSRYCDKCLDKENLVNNQAKCPACERKIMSVFACHEDKPYCVSCCACDDHAEDWEHDIGNATIQCCDCGIVSDEYTEKDTMAICLDCSKKVSS